MLASTGTRVSVKIRAPSNAKPSVQARGENTLPSTFSKEKIGSRAVIMMALAKKMDLPMSRPVFLIMLSLASLLNRSIPSSWAFLSRATNSPSTITTAPSMMMPKSMAPMLSRLALMPLSRRQMKANSSASGIMMLTITVVRQSAMNRNTMTVTSTMPSSRL